MTCHVCVFKHTAEVLTCFHIVKLFRSDRRSQSLTQSITDNLKQPSILQCVTPFSAAIAWICTLAANFTCEFFTIDVVINNLQYFLGFGMWSYQGWTWVAAGDGDGTGGTIYYAQTCYQYGDAISPDSKWKSAQAFSIIAGRFERVLPFTLMTSAFISQNLLHAL